MSRVLGRLFGLLACVIGAEIGAKSAPDGSTLTMGNISTLAINAATFARLPYDSFSCLYLPDQG